MDAKGLFILVTFMVGSNVGSPDFPLAHVVNTRVTACDKHAIDLCAGQNSPPIITYPTNNAMELNITEDRPVGDIIFQCNATDKDDSSTANGTLIFNFQLGNQERRFSMDASNCQIHIAQQLSYEVTQKYVLFLRVIDGYGSENIRQITIYVNDVNNNAPWCTPSLVWGSIFENATAFSSFANINCSDPDTGQGKLFDFIVPLGIKYDTIGASSVNNTAYTLRQIDYDREPHSFTVEVQVIDRGTPKMTSSVTLILSVEDCDDNAPLIVPNTYTAPVKENAELGYSILKIAATDADSPNTPASLIMFESFCTPDVLIVDRYLGDMIVKENIDWEAYKTISCTVVAFSQSSSNSTATVNVDIINVNDGIPTFPQSFYFTSVDENKGQGTTIIRMTANDPDNDTITYTIDTKLFDISSQGDVTIISPPDYEKQRSHLFAVTATDNGLTPLSSTTLFQISINPVNEYAPQLGAAPCEGTVAEDAAYGFQVLTVTATDDDLGLDGELSYTIITTNVPFFIGKSSGVLAVAAKLDYEKITSYSITIQISDKSTKKQLSNTTVCTISVTNVNDQSLECLPPDILVIHYKFPVGGQVMQVNCSGDNNAVPLSYTITDGNDGTFKIDKSTGGILLVSIPQVQQYNLKITVTNGVDIAVVNLTVLAETELKLTVQPATINVMEELPGRLLTTVQACCAFQEITYTLLSGNSDSRVTLTSSNGDLTEMVPYNREYQDQYVYRIQASSVSGQTAIGNFTVNVDDANDNAPTFAFDVMQIKVDATLHTGSLIANLQAKDKDIGINADLIYTISQGNTGLTFAINETGDLTLAKPLDYYMTNSYTLEIMATDKGSSPLTGKATVVVKVEDNSNNPLVLFPTGGSATLSEDCALGMSVFQLQANGSGTKFHYEIVSGNTNNAFQMDPKTGNIIVAKRLDRETTPIYSLNLSATNETGVSVTGSLNVSLTDVNDNNPLLSAGVFVFSVPDQEPAGYTVGVLAVTDADLGLNGTVNLTIQQENPPGAFKFDGFNLKTTIKMNYAVVNYYRLIARAYDLGSPSRATTVVVIVNVLNGNIPHFNVSSGTVSVLENISVGSQIYDVNATDKKAREDGSLIYRIDSGNNLNFGIRQWSGQVVIIKTLDFETQPLPLILTIIGSNGGQPSISATFTLTIILLDVNEFYPLFPQQSFSFAVNENEHPNYYVGTVLANDSDRGPSGEVIETWYGSSDFYLDSRTGMITLKTSLNFLVRPYYMYILTAQDQGVPVLSSLASIVINIIDVNDHHPVITSPTDTEVLDSAPIGFEIFKVSAYDLDTGPAGNLSFQMLDSTQTFSINAVTGIIKNEVTLDGITTATYSVTVRVFDAGNPILDNSTIITINVISTNPNNFDPVFSTSCPSSVIIERKSITGFVVLPCSATDNDNGISGVVEYSINSGNNDGYFVIDYKSGTVTTATKLYTASNFYTIDIVATDGGKPQRNATKTIDITISPAIISNVKVDYNFTISENIAVASVVGMIEVKDGRTVSNYNITTGNYAEAFHIDLNGNNGQLVIKKNLDRELYPRYSLVVKATNDVDVLTIIVEVDVTDVNDNSATFPYPVLNLAIPENSPADTLVGTVSYSDLDTDVVNRNNTLSIQPPGPFSIDQSGNLKLTGSLDYETISRYAATVVVTDNQSPFTTSSLPVNIDVIDVEEKEFVSTSEVTDSALISLETYHQAPLGYLVHTLKEGDFGFIQKMTAVVEFVAYKDISPFSIHKNTGDITVRQKLSRHTKYLLWVMIKVTDGGITTSRTSLIRIDTFDKEREMIVIEFSDSYSYVKTNIPRFRRRAQAFFKKSERIGFCDLVDTSTNSRRRLLALKSASYTYVVSNNTADNMTNINEPKYFMTEQQILDVLQQSRDGTPVIGLSDPSVVGVATVEPFGEKVTKDSFEDFISSPAGIAVFCLLGLLLLVLIILIITCIFYRKCRKNGRNSKKTKEKESPKRKSFSRMSENPSFFSSSPQIIVSAPPPVTLHNSTESPPSQPDQIEATTDNTHKQNNIQNNDTKNQDNTVNNPTKSQSPTHKNNVKDPNVQSGLPSQYGIKNNEKNPHNRKSTPKVTDSNQSNAVTKHQSK